MTDGEGDPVVEEPFLFEREDHQKQVFVDVLQALAPPDPIRVEGLWNERFELRGGVHFGVTSCLPPF
jgi:hypothetical protein